MTVENNEIQQASVKKSRIFGVLKVLKQLQRVRVVHENDYQVINIYHEQRYVPDFLFEWCPHKQHYRAYIHVGDSINDEKTRAGYCIFTMGTSLTAIGFCTMYQFILKNRANSKSQAE